MADFLYRAYGLEFASEIKLPELIPGGSGRDVTIRRGKLSHLAPTPRKRAGWITATQNEVLLYYEGVAYFLVRNGREIIFDPLHGSEPGAQRILLLGYCFGLVLQQRGYFPLHASAVSIDGSVVGFVGSKGWGKSTTAAAFTSHGYELVTDDILALRFTEKGSIHTINAYPQLKLWPEAIVAARGEDPERHAPLHSAIPKRGLRLGGEYSEEWHPLEVIYVLSYGDKPEIVALNHHRAFQEAVRHSYLHILLDETENRAAHLRQCASLAASVFFAELRRPRDLSRISELVDVVERHVAKLRSGRSTDGE